MRVLPLPYKLCKEEKPRIAMSLEQNRYVVDGHCCHGDLDNIVTGTDQVERGWFVGVDVVRVGGRGY